VFNKDKTFRPKRKFEPGTQRFELHKKAQASLNAGLDLKLAVQLPAGEELNDWVAVHVVDFFNRDEHRFRRPTALSAPRYMDLLMDWIEVQINNEDVFPTNVDVHRRFRLMEYQSHQLSHPPGHAGGSRTGAGKAHVHGSVFPACLVPPQAWDLSLV
ncbi:hypothetical protein E2I00_002131, partial [Balaenoptera physalus]